MNQSDTPPKFSLAWAFNAGVAYIRSIPVGSQIGIQNGAASLNDGFPPLTFVPAAGGGTPPFGQDFNGILKQTTQGIQWQQAGGPIFYNSAFATAIGGYPNGAILSSSVTPGTRWMSTTDGNATDPDAGGAGWVQDPGQIPIGTPVQSLSSVVPAGYAPANGLTIGNASSNASSRANPDTKYLFFFLWANCPQCAIFTSTGAGSTRGVSAAADFAANKALATLQMQGLGIFGVDTMGGATTTFLNGVNILFGSTTVPSSAVGENLHALTTAENATHSHANTLADPGHIHANTLTDPGHTHANTLTDPTHTHGTNANSQNLISTANGSGNAMVGEVQAVINPAATGITINNASHTAGVTITNASQTTGTTITNVNSGSGTAHNNVPRNVLVYWNMKL